MQKIEPNQTIDSTHKCCMFAAIRGQDAEGNPVGLVTEVYLEGVDVSHKQLECQVFQVVKQPDYQNFQLADPEVWQVPDQKEAFQKRDYILQTYQEEQRKIYRVDVLDSEC